MKCKLFLILSIFIHFFSTSSACMDLERKVLERKYKNFITTVRNFEEAKYLTKSLNMNLNLQKSKENKTPKQNDEFDFVFSNSQCKTDGWNKTKINEQSVCPWESEFKRREDRYPFFKEEVKCACKTCSNERGAFPKKLFKCMPIQKTLPVLIKTYQCDSDGYFIWNEEFEEINVACSCALRNKIYSHGL